MNELDSRERILKAAITVFSEKGRFGARMEEIAAKAEINKAMLYYYYSTRENLYRETVQYVMTGNLLRIFTKIAPLLANNTDPVEALKGIVAIYFEVFSAEKKFTKLLLELVATNPEELQDAVKAIKAKLQLNIPSNFLMFLEDAMQKQIFRRIDPIHFLLNVLSMTMFYFFGAPVIKAMLDLHIEDEQQFLRERQAAIIDLILHGVINNTNTGQIQG